MGTGRGLHTPDDAHRCGVRFTLEGSAGGLGQPGILWYRLDEIAPDGDGEALSEKVNTFSVLVYWFWVAPPAQARASSSRLTRSSWRTWPHRKLRRKWVVIPSLGWIGCGLTDAVLGAGRRRPSYSEDRRTPRG